ncbi:MAG TPA: C40 family peptidase, partial [Gemmatimonadales bacterium]|nr:C40 family peptidase [Gemmatimonadales bacterium]
AGRPAPPATSGHRTAAVALRQAVIATATDAMGRPYQWGGTGQDGSGFDCSGLIQHAYAEHGIELPRTSAAQAGEGREVKRKVDALAPGDLLTFSNRGGPVTHVGLYVGDGRFIHSASHGVQVSRLSEDDPYGRWWYQRWVGARRIIPDDAGGLPPH